MKEIEWKSKHSSTLKIQYWDGSEYQTFEISSCSPIDTILTFTMDISDYFLIEDDGNN